MAKHGDMAVAGLGVAMKVNMIVVMLLIGLGTGIQPLLGYCYGSHNKKRYLAVLKFSLVLALCLSAVMTVICYFGAAGLVSAFLEDAEAFEFGMSFARIYIISGPILGVLFVLINAIQSTGAALPSLILSISRQGLLYLPILFTINKFFNTPEHLALTQPLTDYLATLLAIILFIITYKSYFNTMEADA
jgi:Na+-driven multidrug efflux pump